MIAQRENIAPTEAIRELLATDTYGLLNDAESYLYFESAEYILSMYDSEKRVTGSVGCICEGSRSGI